MLDWHVSQKRILTKPFFFLNGLVYLLIRLSLVCDRLDYPRVIYRNCNLFFPPLQPNRVNNAVKEFTQNPGKIKGANPAIQSCLPHMFSSLSIEVCHIWYAACEHLFSLLSVYGNSGVCTPKADETVQKSSHNWQASNVLVLISLPTWSHQQHALPLLEHPGQGCSP